MVVLRKSEREKETLIENQVMPLDFTLPVASKIVRKDLVIIILFHIIAAYEIWIDMLVHTDNHKLTRKLFVKNCIWVTDQTPMKSLVAHKFQSKNNNDCCKNWIIYIIIINNYIIWYRIIMNGTLHFETLIYLPQSSLNIPF